MDIEADFTEYAAARWRALVSTAVLWGCERAEAEDLAQQTLLRCYLKWRHVSAAQHRDAYVARIQLNLFRQSRRRRWWRERPSAHVPDQLVTDSYDRADLADGLTRALQRLPTAQREVVVLRYYVHLPEQQVAVIVGAPLGTVKSRLSRALTALEADPGLRDLQEGTI